MNTIESIEEYIKFIEKKAIELGYVYRGQSNKDWDLEPSLYRINTWLKVASTSEKPLSKWKAIEDKLMSKFKTHSLPLINKQPQGYIDWLTLGQHHGLPTRLLDWTINPLVALFFAVNSLSKDDGIVYKQQAIPIYPLEKLNEGNFVEENIFGFIYPNHYSQRVNAQQGCFSLHKYPEGNDKFTPHNKILEDDSEFPESVIIPSKKKFYIKKELDKLGINNFSLFPDLDGLSKYLSWEYERDLTFFR